MAAAHGRISSGLRSPVMWEKELPFLAAQTPDRSGLPSAVRGAVAERSTLPSAVRGMPGVGRFGHCPVRETLITHKIVASLCIGPPSRLAHPFALRILSDRPGDLPSAASSMSI